MRIFDPGIDRSHAETSGNVAYGRNLRLVEATEPSGGSLLWSKASGKKTGDKQIIYTWNLFDKSFLMNEEIKSLLGIPANAHVVKEDDWLKHVYEKDRRIFTELRESLAIKATPFTVHYHITGKNGHTYNVCQKGMPHPTNGLDLIVGVIEIEEQPMSLTPTDSKSTKPEDETVFDYPTDFVRGLREAIDNARKTQSLGALIIVSINNLAMIINAYGHEASEQAMMELCDELQKVVRPQDLVTRIHRDQFGVILTECKKAEINEVVQRFQHIIREYGTHSSLGSLHVISTIGSVDFPDSAHSATEAIDRAYVALRSVQGQGYRSYISSQDDVRASQQQLGLANHLRKAIQENRLRLAYQPIIESKTGRVAHYEALLRIIGEDGKISSAGPLIPIAEQMHLIDMIDHLVLEMVIKELRASPNVVLAFNVSNLTTDSKEWLNQITQLLRDNPDIASRLIVEITETATQHDMRQTSYFVAALQSLGCKVALDDFGSGYTSFRQLKNLSVDMVKIDGAFVKDLVDNADNRFFVKTLLDFTNGFGLEAVAEFVEHGETARMLMELGVHYMQGYYFGKPENHRAWLNKGEFQRG